MTWGYHTRHRAISYVPSIMQSAFSGYCASTSITPKSYKLIGLIPAYTHLS